MYLNEQLFSFFDGLESFAYYQDPTFVPNKVIMMVFRDLKNNYYYPPQLQITPNSAPPQVATSFSIGTTTYTTSPAYFIFTQQYNITGSWNSLESIVFLTHHLPVQVEYIPTSTIYSPTGTSNANFKPILTDFVPTLEEAEAARSRFTYYPSGNYRLIDLHSQIPLRKIDLQMFWQDQYQNLYPLYISCNKSNSVKLMFIKKSLANYNYKSY